jgi:diguanylate cyclase (GGDEF)-like protein
MGTRTKPAAPELSLDEQTLRMYARDITEAVGPGTTVSVFDHLGKVTWSSANPSPAALADGLEEISAPAESKLGRGEYAYDFPLPQSDGPTARLRIISFSKQLGGVKQLVDSLGPTIQCLARQIDINSTLTAKALLSTGIRRELSIIAQINAYVSSHSLEESAQELVQLCRTKLNCRAVVAAIPKQRLMVTAAGDDSLDAQFSDIAARLLASVRKKRRVISVRSTLLDGTEQRVLCAPILSTRRDIEGLVLIISEAHKPEYSKIARTLSSKIASLQQSLEKTSSLLDRPEFVDLIDSTLSGSPDAPHSLVYFDADKVNAFNDAFGYSSGDRLISIFSRILCDSAGVHDSPAHLGSDRFALLMPGASGDTALAKADQVLQFFSQETIEDEFKSIKLTASAGIASTPAMSLTKGGEELLIVAEVAARGAKERGGNQCALYQDLDKSIIQRRSDVDQLGFLQMALIENQFVLYAQRIEAINREPSQKLELLVRLDQKDGVALLPGEFLSAAERYQMMAALDRWVINSALTSIAKAENSLEVNLATFCINVSAQSLQDDSFIDHVEARIAETGVSPDTLCFELTETSMVRYIDRAQRFLHRLQRLGCQVALDDFGTGYSSFEYLKNFPVNFLKIDGSFVRDILENPLSKTIVSSVVQIAEVTGALTVAEHVETSEVHTMLRDLGVHYVQGFSVHRPEPLKDILAAMDSAGPSIEEDSEKIDLRQHTTDLPNVRSAS